MDQAQEIKKVLLGSEGSGRILGAIMMRMEQVWILIDIRCVQI